MNEDPNSLNSIKLRKYQEVLKLCSRGIIVFAIWNIMKLILQIITEGSILFPDFNNADLIVKIIIIVLVIIYVLIDILFRVIVWRRTFKEVNTLKKDNVHIVFSILIIVIKIALFIASLFVGNNENIFSYIVGLLLDIMDTVLLVIIIILTFNFRKLAKEREKVN